MAGNEPTVVCCRCLRTIKLADSSEKDHGNGILYEWFHCADKAACGDAQRSRLSIDRAITDNR